MIPYSEYIFKYNNNNSKEADILIYLKVKLSSETKSLIPVIHYHNEGITISPSGKIYKDLIVMSRIKGKVLKTRQQDDTTCINLKCEPMQRKKYILISLIKLISELHSHDIIYGDTYGGNVIIDDSREPVRISLIDFDKTFFKDKVPVLDK